MEEKVKKLAQEASTKITLNVGGTYYCATAATLAKSEMLSAYASGRWPKDEDGDYFIDKSASKFSYVMKYLRTGKWWLREAGEGQLLWSSVLPPSADRTNQTNRSINPIGALVAQFCMS